MIRKVLSWVGMCEYLDNVRREAARKEKNNGKERKKKKEKGKNKAPTRESTDNRKPFGRK